MMKRENPYLPYPIRIDEVVTETEDKQLKTYKFKFLEPEHEAAFNYMPGQFAELSVAGKGEIPIGIASSPTEKGYLLFTVNRVGLVSTHLHNMLPGQIMGIRGPLGNWYPWERMEGKNVVVIGGGFAFTTLRSSILYMLDPANRDKFGKIEVVYGARNPGLLLYQQEIDAWAERDDINMHITVDGLPEGMDKSEWKHNVGFVPAVVEQKITSTENTVCIVCGPPAMIKFTRPVLDKMGFGHEDIILSLENRMKCGIGMCGRCNVGEKLVCKDGPVFTLSELNELPPDM